MTTYDSGTSIPPSQQDDSQQSKFRPFHIAIIVIVSVFVLLFIGARWLAFRRRRQRGAALAANAATQATRQGPWSQQTQQRESQAALCYEDWLRDVMQRDQQQPQRSATQRTKRSRGLRVTSIRTTPTTAKSQDQDWSGKRSPQLRVVKNDSSKGLCDSVSPSWRESSIDQGLAMHDKDDADMIGLGVDMSAAEPRPAVNDSRGPGKEVHVGKEIVVDVKPIANEKL